MSRKSIVKILILLLVLIAGECILYLALRQRQYYFDSFSIDITRPGFGDLFCGGYTIEVDPNSNRLQVTHKGIIPPPDWDLPENPTWHYHSAAEESYFVNLSDSQMKYIRKTSGKVILSTRTSTSLLANDVRYISLYIDGYRYISNGSAVFNEETSLFQDAFIRQVVVWSGIEF